jgi:hypothetical protein
MMLFGLDASLSAILGPIAFVLLAGVFAQQALAYAAGGPVWRRRARRSWVAVALLAVVCLAFSRDFFATH